jgi:hypothetical protein
MKILIEKASKPYYWYADYIGETFEVKSEIEGNYCVEYHDSMLVGFEDCKVLED